MKIPGTHLGVHETTPEEREELGPAPGPGAGKRELSSVRVARLGGDFRTGVDERHPGPLLLKTKGDHDAHDPGAKDQDLTRVGISPPHPLHLRRRRRHADRQADG